MANFSFEDALRPEQPKAFSFEDALQPPVERPVTTAPTAFGFAEAVKPPEESSFWGEIKRGFGSAWEGLKNLPETLALQRSSLNVDRNMQVLDYLDRIDKGEKFGATVGLDELPVDMSTTIFMYERADPEKRAKLRAKVEADAQLQQEKIMQALPAYAEYQKKLEPYRGRVPDASDIGSLKDFRDWLGFNVAAGTVQLLPIMASAYLTRGQARILAPTGLGTTLALGETIQNRLDFILDKVKTLPPEQQAQAVQDYIAATNDTNMAVAVASGALDLAGPVGSIIRKQLAKEAGKETVEFATKREAAKAAITQAPKEIGEEFLTGGAQEITQIAGERYLGEQTGDVFSPENIKRVFNAAAAEAAGGVSGTGINVGTSVGQQWVKERTEKLAAETLRQEARQALVETSGETILPAYDALVAKYQSEGLSEVDALMAAGAEIARGGGDLELTKTDIGGSESGVSVPSGGVQGSGVTTGTSGTGGPSVGVAGTVAPEVGGGTQAGETALTSQPSVEAPVEVGKGTQVGETALTGQPSVEAPVAPAGVKQDTGVGTTTQETGVGAPDLRSTKLVSDDVEAQVRQTFKPEIADQIVSRANELMVDGAGQQAALQAAEAEVTETLTPEDTYFSEPPQNIVPLDQVTDGTPASQLPVNPATGLKPPGKRGRKPVERTPEEQAAADAQRKERQKIGRDSIRAAQKLQEIIERPFDAATYATREEALAAGRELQNERDTALVAAYGVLNDRSIAPNAKAKQIAQAVINHSSVDPEERQRAQGRASKPDTARADSFAGMTSAQPDTFFGGVTDASRALEHIIQTGNAFEKLLARRIKPFVRGVKVVVVNNPEVDIPDARTRQEFMGAMGLYAEGKDGRVIYLSNLPGLRGINNMTVLHEALHGATLAQISAWMKDPNSVSPQARAAIKDMQNVMLKAYGFYSVLELRGKNDPITRDLYRLGAFTDLKEFVAYGLTQPEMQDFLMEVPGQYKFSGDAPNRGLLTRFVDSIRKLFNMGPQYNSAFQDLVVVTDRLLRAAPAPTAKDTITALAKKVASQNKVLGKLAKSQSATDMNAGIGELMMQTRNAKDAVRLLRSVFDALSVGAIRKILPTQTTADITRWAGDRIRNIKNVNDAVQDMAGMRARMIRELAQKVPEWIEFGRKYEMGARALGDVMHASTLLSVDPTLHANLADALKNDKDLLKLQSQYQAALNDPNKSPKQRATIKGNITKREGELRVVYEGGTVTNPHTGEKYTVSGWDALSKPAFGNGQGKRIYVMARDAYRETFALHQKLLIDKINKANIPGAANEPDSPKGKLIAQITKTFQEAQQLGVYFPLMRFGNFWLRIGKGKSGEFYMFESASARNNYARKRAEETGKTYDEMIDSGDYDVGDDLRAIRDDIAESSQMLKDIFSALEKNSAVDPATGRAAITDVDAIKDQVYQMYLMTLPDRDIRRKFTHRQGKTGFSADVLRNFIVSQHTAANQLSRLAYADKIRLGLGSAYAELAGNPDKLKLSAFVDEIAMRASAEMTPQVPEGFNWDKMASVGNQVVFYYMLTAPKSALIQMTQLPIVGLPALIAEYGAVDTSKITARYSFLFNKLGTSKLDKNGDVITNWGEPSINDSRYVNNHPDPTYRAALKKAWQAAQDRDIFMSTYAADMTSRAAAPTRSQERWIGKGFRATLNLMGGAFHHLERISREIMYMSTFELEFARAKEEGLNTSDATDRAIRAATDMVYETLFNYSQYNKPRIMKSGAIPKLATQFMTYPLQVTSYLMRNFFGMLPFLNKAGKREAAIKFFGTIGMTGLFGGVTGMPLYSFLIGVAEGIRELFRPDMEGDEEDEYYDDDDDGNPLGKRSLDLWFREWFIPQYFGPESSLAAGLGLTEEQALLLQRSVKMGPISAITDLNIGASTSLDGLWFRDDTPAEDSKAAFQEFLMSFTGPFGSMGEQIASAFDEFNNGQFNRGVEKLLPAFFRGAAKSVRLATEGEQTRQGAELREAEWYTTGKLMAQTLGFQSTEVAELQKKNILAKRIVVEVQKDRQQLLDRLALESRRFEDNPTDATEQNVEEVLLDIDRYNYRNSGFLPITAETIQKSLEGRAKRIGQAIEGLTVTEKEAVLLEPLLQRTQVPR